MLTGLAQGPVLSLLGGVGQGQVWTKEAGGFPLPSLSWNPVPYRKWGDVRRKAEIRLLCKCVCVRACVNVHVRVCIFMGARVLCVYV